VPQGGTRAEVPDDQRAPGRPGEREPEALAREIKALAALGVSHVILESRARDLADLTSIYEKFVSDVRSKL